MTIKVKALLYMLALSAVLGLLRQWLLVFAGLALVAVVLALVPSRKLPGHRIRHHRARLHLRLHPARGEATATEISLRHGRTATYRRSRTSRRFLDASSFSVKLGTAQYGLPVRIPLEEHVHVQAPPRSGKTAWLASVIMRYPGPVVSTSTKHDVFELTSGIRARNGKIHVFNPQGIGTVPSTFRFNFVEGCTDPATCIRRADAIAEAVSMGGSEDGGFFTSKASSCLRAILMAAALAGGDARLVARFALGSAEEAEKILMAAGAYQFAAELAELRGQAQKTAQTIKMVLSRALQFMADPKLAQCVIPGDDEPGLDLDAFARSKDTLYLISSGQGESSPMAALFACIVTEAHYAATLAGSQMPGGRLDPAMLIAADEIVQVSPIPLPTMLADSGGKGVQIISVAHGEAQLRTRWQKDGAQAVMDTSGVKLFLPGITDADTLQMASRLCGTVATRERGQDHHSRVDVMTPDMIRALPAGYALAIRAGNSPVIVRLSKAWKLPEYKKARRAGTAVAAITAAPVRELPMDYSMPIVAQEAAGELSDNVTLADDLAQQPERAPAHNPWGV